MPSRPAVFRKKPAAKVFAPQKQTDPFYSSTYWKKVRADYKARFPLCAECLLAGRVAPMKVVDHIVPRRRGGDESDGNLQSLCETHHNRKRGTSDRG
jgi:5-methylcytosine-specific restriction endonuclease McrA